MNLTRKWTIRLKLRNHASLKKEVRRGIYVTNNWYTRFQNYCEGVYSTVPRDAAFLIENGEIKKSGVGMRISDTLPRQFLNIQALGKESRWINGGLKLKLRLYVLLFWLGMFR